MKKKIKKQGNSALIRFTIDEMEINDWKVGDVLDLSDVVKLKEVKKKWKQKMRI